MIDAGLQNNIHALVQRMRSRISAITAAVDRRDPHQVEMANSELDTLFSNARVELAETIGDWIVDKAIRSLVESAVTEFMSENKNVSGAVTGAVDK